MGPEHKVQKSFMKRWLRPNASRPSSHARMDSRSQRTSHSQRKMNQRQQAQETIKTFPVIAQKKPDAPQDGFLCLPDRYTPLQLKKAKEPRSFPGVSTAVRVYDGDSFDVAINLANTRPNNPSEMRPVCVLNMANAFGPGGGFTSGSMAQEEALCYRSTLYATLKKGFYPIRAREAIYSPSVVIFRENAKKGHAFLDLNQPGKLPVMAVVSIAADNNPPLNTKTTPHTYAKEEDRELMKERIRITLRVAAHNGHCSLVLGALGCGVFRNPNEDVVNCFFEVLHEQEFQGWFSNITFAVMGDRRKGATDNYVVFKNKLHGLII